MSKGDSLITILEERNLSSKDPSKRVNLSKVLKNRKSTIDEDKKKDAVRTSPDSRKISTKTAERTSEISDGKKNVRKSDESRKTLADPRRIEVPNEKNDTGASIESREISTSTARQNEVKDGKSDVQTRKESGKIYSTIVRRSQVPDENKDTRTSEESGKISTTLSKRIEAPDEKGDVRPRKKSRKQSATVPRQKETTDEENGVRMGKESTKSVRRSEVPDEKTGVRTNEEPGKVSTTMSKRIEVSDKQNDAQTRKESRKMSTEMASRTEVQDEKKDVRESEESRKKSKISAGRSHVPSEDGDIRSSEETRKISSTTARRSVASDERDDVRTSKESRIMSTEIASRSEVQDEKKYVRESEESRKKSKIIAGRSHVPSEDGNIRSSEETRKISSTTARRSVASDERDDVRTSKESRKMSTEMASRTEVQDEKKDVRESEESRKKSKISAGRSHVPSEDGDIRSIEETRKISSTTARRSVASDERDDVRTSKESRIMSTEIASRSQVQDEKKDVRESEESRKKSKIIAGRRHVPSEDDDIRSSVETRKISSTTARRSVASDERNDVRTSKESRIMSTEIASRTEVQDEKKDVRESEESRKKSKIIAGRSHVPREDGDIRSSEETRKISSTIARRSVASDERDDVRTSKESRIMSTEIASRSEVQDEKKYVRESEESRKKSKIIAGRSHVPSEDDDIRSSEETRKISSTTARRSVASDERNDVRTSKESRKISTGVINVDEKTDNSKKSSHEEIEEESRGKVNKALKEEETCKEYIIKDDVGKFKLTNIINNSIKKAMLNILKEGVYPLADSPENFRKDRYSKMSVNTENQGNQNKPMICPKNHMLIPTMTSAAFDSRSPRSRDFPNPPGIVCNTRVNNRQFNRELYPHRGNASNIKSTRQKEQKPQRSDENMSRLVKGAGVFKTDKRRMTGNVNIYICTEANDSAKVPEKETDEDRDISESQTVSETKTSDSALSVSTSKLVAALKKKRCKNLDEQTLNCFLEAMEDSKRHHSVDDLTDDDRTNDDNNLNVCGEYDFPDSPSLSSIDHCTYDNAKSNDVHTIGSAVERECSCEDFYQYMPHDESNSWLSAPMVDPNYDKYYRTFETHYLDKVSDSDDYCFCYNDKRPSTNRNSAIQKDRKGLPGKSSRRRSSGRTNKCPCIVEEDEKVSDAGEKIPEENTTMVGHRPVDDELSATSDPAMKLGTRASRFDSGETALRMQKLSESHRDGGGTLPVVLRTRRFGERTDLEVRANAEPPIFTSAELSKRRSEELFGERKLSSFQDESFERTDRAGDNEDEQRGKSVFTGSGSHLVIPDEKWKSSNFQPPVTTTMSSKNSKNEKEMGEIIENDTEAVYIDQQNQQVRADVPIGNEEEKNSFAEFTRTVEESPIDTRDKALNPEKKSRPRISMAIASRKSSVAASRNSFNANSAAASVPDGIFVPNSLDDATKTDNSSVKNDLYESGNLRGGFDNSYNNTDLLNVISCENRESENYGSPRETRDSSVTCQLPNCEQSMNERENSSMKGTKPEQESRGYRCNSKALCCCDSEENSQKIQHPPVSRHRAVNMPRVRCNRRCNEKKPKSMICVYCDNPRDKCTCNAPIRNCTQCCLSSDICNCTTLCRDCKDRQTETLDHVDKRTIRVTAWKPRPDVRRYFARSPENVDGISKEVCNCRENPRIRGTDELPYQKRQVFSDVMSELQQKMIGSAYCRICEELPCSCYYAGVKSAKDACARSIDERRKVGKSRVRSPTNSWADDSKWAPRRNDVEQRCPKIICHKCRTSPCRCKRSENTLRKNRQLKCYYCKNSPCTCIPVIETDNPRPFQNADSSHHL